MYPTEIATPFHRDGWVYEEKADGYRMAAVKVDNCLGLISRHGTHYTHRFPELVAAIGALDAETFILDGELVMVDSVPPARVERSPNEEASLPVYIAFDVLELGGRDLRSQPLKARRLALEGLAEGQDLILPARKAFEQWSRSVGASDPRGLRRPGGQRPGVALRAGAHPAMAEREMGRLSKRNAERTRELKHPFAHSMT
jgi:ATP-dependent DNA ligase